MKVKDLFSENKTKLGTRETEQLMSHILQTDRSYLYAHGNDEVDSKSMEAVKTAVDRRIAGEPLQYILASADFMGLELFVDNRVLIPRPETELLCEEAKRILLLTSAPCDPDKCRFCFQKEDCDSKAGPKGLNILDVCTGSGAIAAYLATEFPEAEITASDISSDALAVSKINFDRIGKKVMLVQSDLFDSISGQYDLITANPPYIPAEVVLTLDPVVRDYEPHLALDGGENGFELPFRLIKESLSHLKPGGTLLMEIGDDQGPRSLEAAANCGFRSCRIIKDYAGQDRILVASL